jgi:hypothetical protein
MFHMAGDSGLFRELDELDVEHSDGWEIRSGAGKYVPLYEAKLVWHYDHRLSSYAMRAASSRDTELPRLTDSMHDDPTMEAGPLYWVPESEVRKKLAGRWNRGWLLGWRDITGAHLARTMIASVIPTAGVGHNFPFAFLGDAGHGHVLHALFSSLAFDYVVRQKMSGIHMTYSVLKQVAVPHNDSFKQPAPWDPQRTLAQWIRPCVLELSYTSNRLKPYAQELGDDGEPFRWVPERRAILQAELDGAFMHIYGFQRADVEHILGTFRTLASTEEKTIGEYRTRRLVLAAYDGMTAATAAGGGWKSAAGDSPGRGPRHNAADGATRNADGAD